MNIEVKHIIYAILLAVFANLIAMYIFEKLKSK